MEFSRSLSGLGNPCENSAERGQVLSILQVNSCSTDQESGEIWTVQTDLQQIYSKPDSLLAEDFAGQVLETTKPARHRSTLDGFKPLIS
jgi:hypothetical protein